MLLTVLLACRDVDSGQTCIQLGPSLLHATPHAAADQCMPASIWPGKPWPSSSVVDDDEREQDGLLSSIEDERLQQVDLLAMVRLAEATTPAEVKASQVSSWTARSMHVAEHQGERQCSWRVGCGQSSIHQGASECHTSR